MANNLSKNNIDEVDAAYLVLKTAGHPLHYRELIEQATVAAKGSATRPPAYVIADIHTRINLDSRFVHAGKGMWGLAEWSPQRVNLHEVEETASSSDTQRREKLFAAIQQDFETEEPSGMADPDHLLEAEHEIDEEEDEEVNT